MTRGSCDNKGGRSRFLRLIFYVTAAIAVCGLFAFLLCRSMGETGQSKGAYEADEITFVLNNGEADIVCGVLDEVPSPNRIGYYLCGWYTDEDLTTRIDIETLADILGEGNANKYISWDYKLYAKWQELRTMTGVRMKDTFFIYDGKAHEPEIEGLPEGASVEYLGEEEYREAGEYEVEATVSAYGYYDIVIRGKLSISKAKIDISGIRFEDKTVRWDGSEKSIEIEGELPKGVSVSYENNGRTEVGEYEVIARFDGGNNYESIADMKATLRIIAEAYEITLVEEDGTRRVITVESGENAEIPKPREKRGYIGRWSIEDWESVHADVTVYAVYEAVRYRIEYEASGGQLDGDTVTEYTVEDNVILKEAEREYYSFGGWYESISCDGERIEDIALDSVGDRKYYAKWIEIEYTVEYELNGGQNNAHNVNRGMAYVYTVSDEDLTLSAPTRNGYEFLRWTDGNGDEITVICASAPSMIILYAEWEIIRYRISYELNGGENDEANADEYTAESGEIRFASPSRDKYIFMGWYEDAEFGGRAIESIYGTECRDIRLYAKWESTVFTVESVDGRNVITWYDYELGADVVIPAIVDGKRIDGIASGVLSNAERVEIEGMEEINADAFAGCERLVELILPITLNSLPSGMLGDCISLERLTVPYASDRKIGSKYGEYYPMSSLFGRSAREECYAVEVRTANLTQEQEEIAADNLFKEYKCYVPKSLKEITVLGGEIAPYALYGLTSVERVSILGDCEGIGMRALAGCTALESVELSESITTVKKSAFENCVSLQMIYIAEGMDEAILSTALNSLQDNGIYVSLVKYKVDFQTVLD